MTFIRNNDLAFALAAIMSWDRPRGSLIDNLYDAILTTDPSNEELVEVMNRLRVIDPTESHVAAWVRDLIRDEFDAIEGI